uniref:Protein SpAN n=1 Tax=Magallana gigas TaxID=29159 RepID=K1PWY8_MAGGI
MMLLFLVTAASLLVFSTGAPLTGAGVGLHNFFNVYVGMSPPRPAVNNLLPNQPKQQIVRQQPDDERNPKPWTFESDMSLTPAQMRAIKMDILRRRIGVPIRTRKIVADGRYYWPNAVIPYETRSLGRCRTNFVCQNGGFIGPNCNCICPYGISGFTCDEVAKSTPNCGGTLRGENGTILSPNYPNDYYSNTECHWLIEGTFDFLKLTFRDFHTEDQYDILDIRVYGPERVGQRISGNNFGDKVIYFSSNKLLLHFTSDQNTNFRGFRIEYCSIHTIDIDSH